RSLDAVHLTSALSVVAVLVTIVTYDSNMATAAAGYGLEVLAPSGRYKSTLLANCINAWTASADTRTEISVWPRLRTCASGISGIMTIPASAGAKSCAINIEVVGVARITCICACLGQYGSPDTSQGTARYDSPCLNVVLAL